MKIFKNTFILFTLLVCLLSSCSDPLNNGMSSDDFHLTITIDGTEYITNNSRVSFAPDVVGGLYNITGTGLNNENSWITLNLASPTSEGTFTVQEPNVTLFYTTRSSVWGASEQSGSGTINITKNTSEYMEGTFSFTGSNPADQTSREFINGSFKAEKF